MLVIMLNKAKSSIPNNGNVLSSIMQFYNIYLHDYAKLYGEKYFLDMSSLKCTTEILFSKCN